MHCKWFSIISHISVATLYSELIIYVILKWKLTKCRLSSFKFQSPEKPAMRLGVSWGLGLAAFDALRSYLVRPIVGAEVTLTFCCVIRILNMAAFHSTDCGGAFQESLPPSVVLFMFYFLTDFPFHTMEII